MENLSNELIGTSAVITELRQALKDIAASDANIMITGESGSGKEFVINELMKLINKDYIFQKINCSHLKNDKNLFQKMIDENAGALNNSTDAAEPVKKNKILYLKKICDLDMELQKELIVIMDNFKKSAENKSNCSHSIKNLRIISSSAKNIDYLTETGKFRSDLFYRLGMIKIELPPLRERREDIPVLIEYFIDKFNKKHNKIVQKIDDSALPVLMNYNYPGNILELENIIEYAVIISNSNEIKEIKLKNI
ncbi:MAG TPA: sigma 54-interacting transcriptional regulator [bacterium]|nr:sigma 54-interacting transcriptional regulator [bacterium]HPN30546.1 sigma 54-interacting transcriptional regulator [bacterium]